MIRNIRTLGLAFFAVLAMSAVGASAAQAVPKFESSSYPTTVTGSNTIGNEVFTTEGGKVECDSHFQGTQGAASSTFTAHPVYTGCTAFGFVEATVNTTGCDYEFHATEKVAANVYNVHTDVKCSGANTIKITAATCKAEVKPQTGLTTTKMENVAAGDIKVTPNVTGIAYTVTQDGFLCPFGGTGNKTDGKYTGSVTVAGTGGQNISITGE